MMMTRWGEWKEEEEMEGEMAEKGEEENNIEMTMMYKRVRLKRRRIKTFTALPIFQNYPYKNLS